MFNRRPTPNPNPSDPSPPPPPLPKRTVPPITPNPPSDAMKQVAEVVAGYRGPKIGSGARQGLGSGRKEPGQVYAHFMLGNTYPYNPSDWLSTLQLAQSTHLDALILNLGPEEWQFNQARLAYNVATTLTPLDRNRGRGDGTDGEGEGVGLGGEALPFTENPIKLALSLDMNVLPSTTKEDMNTLIDLITELARSPAQLKTRRKHLPSASASASNSTDADLIWKPEPQGVLGGGREKVVLSTFGGGDVGFGGVGWRGFMEECRERGVEVYFIPAFFLPPEKILEMPFVDGTMNWNAGWPTGDNTIDLSQDAPFINATKPYMASVSPWFSTHYGTTGDWAFNKNWIYRSDDNLYASRWMQILDEGFAPEFVEILTWNDYGESNYIGPVTGAQPGSEAWTTDMPHEAWREMTKWFIRRYKGVALGSETEFRVYLTYRTQPKAMVISSDSVGRPTRADYAQDVIAIVITVPGAYSYDTKLQLNVQAGNSTSTSRSLAVAPKKGIATLLVPFSPGAVDFELLAEGKVILRGKGRDIDGGEGQASANGTIYNFNAWTGSWAV